MNRVSFIIDGFNLYHSVREDEADTDGQSTRWLDIKRLCTSYLHLFGKDATLASAHYFSALARHLESRKPDVTQRHRSFLECLTASGVEVHLNRFKQRECTCVHCKRTFAKHEEKETDVAIAVEILRLLHDDACDTVAIISGDTDIAPAVRAVQEMYPSKSVVFAFPYNRVNNELKKLAPGSFSISKSQYCSHQFPDPYLLPDGRQIIKPPKW